jgi:tetratricopeptide (TPR) repeat protein
MHRYDRLLAVVAIVAGLGLASGAYAHGGGGGGSSAGGGGMSGGGGGGTSAGAAGGASAGAGASAGSGHNGGRTVVPDCPRGFVMKNGACTRAAAGVLPDAQLYAEGRALALAGYYAEALPILEAVARTDDPMVFTMRGFAERKLGHVQTALALYDRALAIDPGNVNTHEYLGEAYVTQGRLDLARIELVKVEKGCGGTGCKQYEDLAQAIATGRTE